MKRTWFSRFLFVLALSSVILMIWAIFFPAYAGSLPMPGPTSVNPLVLGDTPPDFGPAVPVPTGTGEVTPVLPNADGTVRVISFRDIFTPENMVILLAWFTAVFTSWIKRVVNSQNWQTFAINVGLNIAAKGVFPLIWGVYGPFGGDALEAAVSAVIIGLIADKALYEFFTHTSAKGATKAQAADIPVLSNLSDQELGHLMQSRTFDEYLRGSGKNIGMIVGDGFSPAVPFDAVPKGDIWDFAGSLLEFGIKYLIDQLAGKNYAADRVLRVIGPILTDMARYEGRVSASMRLEFQARIDDALRLLDAEGGQ